MLYWRYSSNRIFFLNEYWILIPTAIIANYLIIRQIRLTKKKIKQLKRLSEQIERAKRMRRILLLSLGVNECLHLLMRGGSTEFINYIDSDYIMAQCTIEPGVQYLDDTRLRNIITDLYSHKRKGKIIYVTATALCHTLKHYGQNFPALPFAIRDFGLTNVYQTVRKIVVTIQLGAVGPLVVIGGPLALIGAFALSLSGLKLAYTDLDFIPTTPVDVKNLKPRIADISEVVVVNNRREKMIMSEVVQENRECWLPDQKFLNPNCQMKSTEIPDTIDSVLPNLKYEETVNMRDVTGLDRVDFTDKLDLGHHNEPSICKKLPRKGKEVRFLDKFGDSGPIGEQDGWDICENEIMVPEKRYLRTRN